jgi:hypothetical protein
MNWCHCTHASQEWSVWEPLEEFEKRKVHTVTAGGFARRCFAIFLIVLSIGRSCLFATFLMFYDLSINRRNIKSPPPSAI